MVAHFRPLWVVMLSSRRMAVSWKRVEDTHERRNSERPYSLQQETELMNKVFYT